MNDAEKKVYEQLLADITNKSASNNRFSIESARLFLEIVAARIAAEKGKGAWC